jgi:hypothetical protein
MIDLMQEADFVGKKALRRIKEQGVSRKLIGFEIGGQLVGCVDSIVSSAVFSLAERVSVAATTRVGSGRLEARTGTVPSPHRLKQTCQRKRADSNSSMPPFVSWSYAPTGRKPARSWTRIARLLRWRRTGGSGSV